MDNRELHAAYLEEIRGTKLLRSLRFGIGVVLALNTAFIGADLLAHQAQLVPLVAVRAITNVALLAVLLAAGHILSPLAGTMLGCLATGSSLVAIISVAGGVDSGYAPGLMLLFLGMPVLLPLTPGFAAWIVLSLLAMLLGAPFALGEAFAWNEYFIYACFPAAAAAECVASCVALDRLRFNDFIQRAQLKLARDELKELDLAKSRFTANIHHELRTPLTLMLAPLEALRSGDFGAIPPAIDRTLRTMQANGLRLLKLINNLLDLAKVESEQLDVRRVPVELGRLVGEVAEGARGLAERKGVALEVHVAPEVGVVNADPDAVEKVLVNLLGNALKFTDRGAIKVELRPARPEELVGPDGARPAEGEDAEGAEVSPGEAGAGVSTVAAPRAGVHLTVLDSGAGIPPEQLGKVFDRFAQVDGSATRRHEGTGIGLSLVKELVELHGGRVWAASAGLGKGAAMHVVLPVGEPDGEAEEEVMLGGDGQQGFTAAASFRALAAEVGVDLDTARLVDLEHTVSRYEGAGAAAEDDLAELPEHAEGTPEVVVAEDNPEMRRLLALLIGREYRVRPARHGAEALAFVRERAPELVVTDVMMPEMSGTELCRAIKADAATRGVPVMLVTSKAEREMKIEGLELGAEDYVTKPFHPRELMARVRALVRLRSLQQELAASNETLARSNADLARALEDLKAAEVQLVQAERLAAVGELSAGVAHEVNNPLNFARNALGTLRGLVEDVQAFGARLAELDPSDPAQLEALAREKEALHVDHAVADLGELTTIVTEGLDRTARLVAELRDFASPARRRDGPVDVVAGLQGTLRLMAHRLKEAGAALETELPGGLPPVRGDAGALNQVFLNLLKNAAEALEGQGGGPLRVTAEAGADALVVRVHDGGPGMDSATRARLFEPFFTTKQAGRGTGLGLSICQRIVADHGGSIDVASAPGEGTTFTVRLPAAGGTASPEEGGLGA